MVIKNLFFLNVKNICLKDLNNLNSYIRTIFQRAGKENTRVITGDAGDFLEVVTEVKLFQDMYVFCLKLFFYMQ